MSKSYWFAVSLLFFALPAAAQDQKAATPADRPHVEATTHRDLTATVIAIDKTTRVVKMRTEAGDTVTVVAGPAVKNFASIKVTDVVKAKITESVSIDVATGSEMRDTSEVSATSAQPGESPHGEITNRTRSTATIVAIDTTASTVTLKGQDGNTYTAKAKHKENLQKVKVGDLIVFTVTRSVAASVQKAGAK